MPSRGIAVGTVPVLAAGVGVRHGTGWPLRAVSFRRNWPVPGRPAIGIATAQSAAGSAVVDMLSGAARPAHGELRVMGQDLTTAAGRAAVRGMVGVARRRDRPQPPLRVRGLIARRARVTRLPRQDRDLLTAAILDRLGLTPWADVPVRATPPAVGRRARLAAAAVHQPDLLLLDAMFEGLDPLGLSALAECVRELSGDTAIIATGRDPAVLGRVCDEVLTLADGVLFAS